MTIQDHLRILCKTPPGRDLLDGRWNLSYAEALAKARKIATYWQHEKLARGDVIAVSLRDDAEVTCLFLAAILTGIVPVFVDADATDAEFEHLFQTARPKWLLVEQDLAERWDLATLAADTPTRIHQPTQTNVASRWGFARRRKQNADTSQFPACLEALAAADLDCTVSKGSQLALLLYTSGTTAGPKIVPLTVDNLTVQAQVMRDQLRWDSATRVFNLMPITHVDGLITGVLTTVLAGGTMIRWDPFSVPRLPEILDAIYKFRTTHAVFVPTLVSLMLQLEQETQEAFVDSEFEFAVSTAAALAEDLWRKFEQVTGKRIVNMWGMSEIGNLLFSGPDQGTRQIGSIGAACGCETLVLREDGEVAASGEVGELLIHGPSVTPGYLGVDTPMVTRDGKRWFATGDLVNENADGIFQIVGRKKDLIITGGHNVAPEEVNRVLLSVPGVVEAATFGVADKTWGERIAACVVTNHGSFSESAALSAVAEQLAPFKVPRELYVVPELPKNRSGKVFLPELRERAERGEFAAAAGDCKDVEATVLQLAARSFRTAREELSIDDGPDQCVGWDSMAHLDFVVALEAAFEISLSPREVMSIRQLSAAVELVHEHLRQTARS